MAQKSFTKAELSVVGKAKCGCVHHRAQGIPCEHDLNVLASVRNKFRNSYSIFPLDREQIEFLEAATNRVTYDEAMEQIRHNVAFRQQLPHLSSRITESLAALKKMSSTPL